MLLKLSKITKRLKLAVGRPRGRWLFLVCALTLGALWALPAQAQTLSAIGNGILWGLSQIGLAIATLFIKLSIFVMSFLVEVAGYNGFLDTPAVEVGWVMVRDVTNMFFVIVLLIIAFGTILGLEQYEWKKMMVKFVLAAILVNFSRTICGVFIDVAQVFTVTFVNGVAATAGGNLINMFEMDKILSFSRNVNPDDLGGLNRFAAVFGALMFSAAMFFVLLGYLGIMIFRMLSLWVLIILSPIAFVTSLIPQSQKWSQQWWQEFGNNVAIGPILMFFVWLSFVTVGSGNIHAHIQNESVAAMNLELTTADIDAVGQQSASIGEIMEWSNMASFFIAVGMLMVGLKVTQQLGVAGGNFMSNAIEWGKKAATIGTGVAAGIWAAKGIGEVAKLPGAAGKAALWYAPLVGGEKWATMGKTVWENVKVSYFRKGTGLTKESLETQQKLAMAQTELAEKEQDLQITPPDDEAKRATLTDEIKAKKAEVARLSGEVENYLMGKEDKAQKLGRLREERDALSKKRDIAPPNQVAELDQQIKQKDEAIGGLQKAMSAPTAGGIIGWLARRGISQEKHLAKSQKQAETLQKLAWKRTGAEAGGWIFNRSKRQINAQDRVERGILAAEEERSKAKDIEFETKGRLATLAAARQKFDKWGFSIFDKELGKGSMLDQIAGHQRRGGTAENYIKALTAGAEIKIDVKAREKAQGVVDYRNEQLQAILPQTYKNLQAKMDQTKAYVDKTEKNIDAAYKKRIENVENELKDEQSPWNAPMYKAGKEYEDYVKSEGYWKDRESGEQKNREAAIQAERDEARDKWTQERTPLVKEIENLEKESEKTKDDALRETLEKQIKEKKKPLDEMDRKFYENDGKLLERTGMTAKEEDLFNAVNAAAKERSESQAFKDKKAEIDKLIEERDRAVTRVRQRMLAPIENQLRMYETSTGKYQGKGRKEQMDNNPEYQRKARAVEQEVARQETELRGQLGIGGAMAAAQAELMEKGAEAAKERLRGVALGLRSMEKLLEETIDSEDWADAGKKIQDKIRQIKLAKGFDEAVKQVKKGAEKLASGAAKSVKEAFANLGPTAMAVAAETENSYYTTLAETSKKQVSDITDTLVSGERFNVDTPFSAFKTLIKKRLEETFQGVEREKAVVMGLGSLEHMIDLRDKLKIEGKEMAADQKAQMMATASYLTKQAWSDDLLARIVNVINDAPKLRGKDRERAESLRRVFIDKLGWGYADKDGVVRIRENVSSNKRTNELHRLLGNAGDVESLQSENAVLKMMRVRGKDATYLDSGQVLTDKIKAEIKLKGDDVNKVNWGELAQKLKFDTVLRGERLDISATELETFAKQFGVATKETTEVMKNFKDTMEQYAEAKELLTDFKNYALETAHMDDGGHTYYDMKDKMARGQLYDDARDFILSDWRKVDGNKRVKSLKIHTLLKMDEIYGIGRYFDRKNWQATYDGASDEYIQKLMDVRNQNLIIGLAADEKALVDSRTKALQVIHKDSEYLKAHGGDLTYAMEALARNWAVALDTHPEVLLHQLGKRSGKSWRQSMKGELNIDVGHGEQTTHISNVEELVEWINRYRGDRRKFESDRLSKFQEDDEEFFALSSQKIRAILEGMEEDRNSGKKKGSRQSAGF